MAARFTRWRELSDFQARIVGIVDVQSAFAVAPNSRSRDFSRSILAELLGGGLDFPHAEREMILCAERFVIGGGRNVQHVLNPVIAIRNLQFVPVQPVVLEPTLPIQLEAKRIDIESILRSRVFDHKSGVKETRADLIRSWRWWIIDRGSVTFDETNDVAFRIGNSEMRAAIF